MDAGRLQIAYAECELRGTAVSHEYGEIFVGLSWVQPVFAFNHFAVVLDHFVNGRRIQAAVFGAVVVYFAQEPVSGLIFI